MKEWYLKVVKDNYANFEGRARRSEYWYFVLVNFIVGFIIGFINSFIDFDISILSTIYSLAVLVPSIAVAIRRLHDTGKSGWWYLLILLPVIGWIWLIVLLATDGDKGPNEYGQDPKNPFNEIDDIGKAEVF